jgi:Fe/S biogenesis protein NfuA
VFNGTEEVPTGLEAEAVIALLDEKINPSVAAHGGRISLVDVTDHVAYVRMEGGCQGCSASAVTLQQGVQNAILTEVPTIQGVVDVTEHAMGDNPFFS